MPFLRSVLASYIEVTRPGKEDALSIRHPGSVVSQNAGDLPRRAAQRGHDPEGLLGLRSQMVAQQQLRPVRGEIAERGRGYLRWYSQGARFAVRDERLGQHCAP